MRAGIERALLRCSRDIRLTFNRGREVVRIVLQFRAQSRAGLLPSPVYAADIALSFSAGLIALV
jgi:hypothetical protein